MNIICKHNTHRSALPVLGLALCIWFVLFEIGFAASPDFPKLTGRVVDQAQIISAEDEARLTKQLSEVEGQSTDQIVVVTLKSLGGYPIEDYGYQLGRHWGIGQAGKDNGVLLIIAPNERQVRIEVGRGLEGNLPDSLAGLIIQRRILPHFKKGNLVAGIFAGVEDIKASLLGNGEEVALRARKPVAKIDPLLPFIFFAFWLVPFIYLISSLARDRQVGGRMPGGVVIVPADFGGASDGWSGTGGFRRPRSGGFSGGGGSFGGGGASGSW
ncbi:hypothetical protein NBRC116602_12100 [Hyphomicrobiales bacterium 4NK60-0047b]